MIRENIHIARPFGLTGDPSQAGKRLPYGAPRIETHAVGLEGGIAGGSSRLTGQVQANFTYDEYTADSDPVAGDFELGW